MSNEQLLGSRQRQFIDGLPEHSPTNQLDQRNPLSEEYSNHVLTNREGTTSAPLLRVENSNPGASISARDASQPKSDASAPSTSSDDKSASGRSAGDTTGSGDASTGSGEKLSLPQAKIAFSEEHKIKISTEHDKFVYSMQYGGAQHKLFETSADQKGLDSASTQLKSLVADEEKSLSAAYKVSFAKAGEFVAKQKETSESPDSANAVVARDPELFELKGIRAALEKSGPSNVAADGKTGVKFYELTDRVITGIDSLATFQQDKDNKPSVYLWPKFQSLDFATEADRTPDQRLPFTDGNRRESVEGAVIHELGHHQFSKLGYDPKTNPNALASETKLFERMGWKKRLDEKDSDYNWLLQAKEKSDNGQPATYLPEFTGMFFSFGRWRQVGGPENEQGHLGPADKMQRLGESEMEAHARVKPPSWYFESPEEEYAKAVRAFRTSTESRAALQKNSPELFTLMKENDQREINQLYGTNSDGTPKKTRNENGEIVDSKR
ncbi:MAG TPA: hypothetical protein V6C76_00370 [Drouetiella sp.]